MPAPVVPTLVLLCGLPGSGKSTFANAVAGPSSGVGRKAPTWLHVAPDDVGTVEECKRLVAKQLKHRGCVLLDRCNASHKERQMFVREAQEFAPVNVEVVFFDVPADVCISRAESRKGHPTLDPANAAKVIQQFAATFRPPLQLQEGPYAAIHVVSATTPQASMRALLLHLRDTAVSGPRAFVMPE
jgi:predicted kinase